MIIDLQTVSTIVAILLAIVTITWIIIQIRDHLRRRSGSGKPEITGEVHGPGSLFIIGPTADYKSFRLRLDVLIFLRNKRPANTTVWIENVTIEGKIPKEDYDIEQVSLRKRDAAYSAGGKTTVNIDGGSSAEALAEIRLLIPNDNLERWDKDSDGELLLGETYGTKIAPTKLKIRLSSEPVPPVPPS